MIAVGLAGALAGCEGSPGFEDAGESSAEVYEDPLSLPAEPTLDPADFDSAKVCAGCHPTHASEWQYSRHARSMRDPVFQALVERRRSEGLEDSFCVQCHSAICARGGDCDPGFAFDALPDIALEGVTCESCHKVGELVRPFNAGFTLDGGGPIRGPSPVSPESPYHATEHGAHLEKSDFCASCHDVVEPSGLVLERPFLEWLESPAFPEQTCQSCHMPSYTGSATPWGPERELHRHTFTGVDLPLEGDIEDPAVLAMLDAEIEALLDGAASVELSLPEQAVAGAELDIGVRVTNHIAGHAFPTGSTFMRQVWIELEVRDVHQALVYVTGGLDAAGDLCDRWSTLAPNTDPDLVVIGSTLLDEQGQPELYSWRAHGHESNALAPMSARDYRFSPHIPGGLEGPLTITARLHFRALPPFLLRELGLDELVDLAVVRDLDSDVALLPVSAG